MCTSRSRPTVYIINVCVCVMFSPTCCLSLAVYMFVLVGIYFYLTLVAAHKLYKLSNSNTVLNY